MGRSLRELWGFFEILANLSSLWKMDCNGSEAVLNRCVFRFPCRKYFRPAFSSLHARKSLINGAITGYSSLVRTVSSFSRDSKSRVCRVCTGTGFDLPPKARKKSLPPCQTLIGNYLVLATVLATVQ